VAAAKKTAHVVEARMLSPSVRSLRLAPDDGPVSFAAGQWIDLYVPTERGVQKRAYSIASAPDDPALEVAVTLVSSGTASPALHALGTGGALAVDGPFGFFTHDPALAGTPCLFVATGTGLSPLRSMLFAWRKRAQCAPITLLFGVRTQADILWGEELMGWAREIPEFSLAVTLSRPEAGWTGRVGYVQSHVAELARALGEPHVFICGLNRMVGAVRALCKEELGYDRRRIHSERYD
jgi:CDP-4-dehydro-6-deoxyglucose reductase, E3